MNNPIHNPIKIVTVEDSTVVAGRLRNMLSDIEGLNFMGNATNIDDALQMIVSENPAILILDLHLREDAPFRSGINLLATVRANYTDMSIIIFSNLSTSQYRERCTALGADYFFDKSTDFDLITSTLKKIVHSKSK